MPMTPPPPFAMHPGPLPLPPPPSPGHHRRRPQPDAAGGSAGAAERVWLLALHRVSRLYRPLERPCGAVQHGACRLHLQHHGLLAHHRAVRGHGDAVRAGACMSRGVGGQGCAISRGWVGEGQEGGCMSTECRSCRTRRVRAARASRRGACAWHIFRLASWRARPPAQAGCQRARRRRPPPPPPTARAACCPCPPPHPRPTAPATT